MAFTTCRCTASIPSRPIPSIHPSIIAPQSSKKHKRAFHSHSNANPKQNTPRLM